MSVKTVIVYNFDHVRAAVQNAAGRRFALLSPPGCPAFQGIFWWRALIARARADHPDAEFTAILDCGDDAGYALAALSENCGPIRLNENGPASGAVKMLAEQRGAWGGGSGGSDTLDLLGDCDPDLACRDFFRT